MEDKTEYSHVMKLRMLEILWQTARGGRSKDWFDGRKPQEDEERREATNALVQTDLIIKCADYPQTNSRAYELTEKGRSFLDKVEARIPVRRSLEVSGLDWARVDEIEFPRL